MTLISGINTQNTIYPTPNGSSNSNASTVAFGLNGNKSAPIGDSFQTTSEFNLTEEQFRKKLEDLFRSYGVELADIKSELDAYIENKRQNSLLQCSGHHNNRPKRELSPEIMENIYNHYQNLLERIKQSGQEVTLNTLRNTENEIVNEKVELVFSKNKDKYTIEDIVDAGLDREFARVARNNLENLTEEEFQTLINSYKVAWQENSTDSRTRFQTARNYYLVSPYMSIEEFQNGIANGDIKGLYERAGIIAEDTPEEAQAKLNVYFEEQNRVQLGRIEAGEKPEALISEQLKDTLIMFAASNGDEKMWLAHCIEHMYTDNREAFLEAVLSNLDDNQRREFANLINNRELQEILRNPDILNHHITEESGTNIAYLVTQNQDVEVVRQNNQEYTNDLIEFLNRDDVKNILQKINNGEELSPEEERLYNEYIALKGGAQGQILGSASNVNASNEEREQLVQEYCSTLQNTEIYDEIIAKVKEYIEQNPNCTKISSKDFEKILQNVCSESNQSNTTTSVSKTNTTQANNNITQNPVEQNHLRTGFTENPIESNQRNSEAAKVNNEKITTAQMELDSALKNGPAGIITYIMKNQSYGVIELLKEDNLPPYAKNFAIEWFKTYETEQFKILSNPTAPSSVIEILLPHASKLTLTALEGETFSSFRTKQLVDDAIEEMEEKA